MSQLVETPPSLSYLRDDEGSGSGEQPEAPWNGDDGTDWDGEEGSGSGNGAIGNLLVPYNFFKIIIDKTLIYFFTLI